MEHLTLENIIKFIGLITSLVLIFKQLNELTLNKKEKLRADYELLEKLLAHDRWQSIPDFLLEKGYLSINGKTLNASEIRFILSTKDHISKFRLFEQAQNYLTINVNEDGSHKITYKKQFTSISITIKKHLNGAMYFITAGLLFSPVLFLNQVLSILEASYLISVIWIITLGALAYIFLREYWNIDAAQQIINEAWKKRE